MRVTLRISLMVALAAVSACNKPASENNVAITDINNAAPSDIEALPPDESSATPSNELVNGVDNAEVNDLNSSGNSY